MLYLSQGSVQEHICVKKERKKDQQSSNSQLLVNEERTLPLSCNHCPNAPNFEWIFIELETILTDYESVWLSVGGGGGGLMHTASNLNEKRQ